MAKKARKRKSKKRSGLRERVQRSVRLVRLTLLGLFAVVAVWVAAYGLLPVPVTAYMVSERVRIGAPLDREWTRIEDVSLHLQRAVVAAEDANFCLHWGFDMDAIRAAIAEGAQRGGSTISQQTVKNAFLWHGRSWGRKALEAVITPIMELFWSKRRVLEVYLNVAEFDEGVFGAEAAALHYFGVPAAELSPSQAARLAAVLPNPQNRSAVAPSPATAARATGIANGAATIAADGRDMCFAN